MRLGSFSAAAEFLNLTKGAVSYQIRQLEDELGFAVFTRLARGIRLTAQGEQLLAASTPALETIQRKIEQLRQPEDPGLTIGVTTYFASRWLSPRLMEFMRMHPDIRLRIQPTVNVVDLETEGLDLAIRWGCGDWTDVAVDPLFLCPAWPVGDRAAHELVEQVGVEAAFERFTLLHDHDNSGAWGDWFALANLPYIQRKDTLVVPDPNVRVQAVIDGQGVAINDRLVEQELANGQLFRLSPHELTNYGYYLVLPTAFPIRSSVERFSGWLRQSG